jgi:hypothetical protein
MRHKSHAARLEWLEREQRQADKKHDRDVKDLQAKIASAGAKREAIRSKAKEIFVAEVSLAKDALAHDWYQKTLPLFRAYLAEPSRAAALPIGAAFRELDERCQRELGEALNDHLPAHTIVMLLRDVSPAIVNAMPDGIAVSMFGRGPASHAAAFAAAARGGDVAAMSATLASLEALLQRAASEATGAPAEQAAEIHDAIALCATARDETKAIESIHRRRNGWRPPAATSQFDAHPVTVRHPNVQLQPGSDLPAE